MDTKVVLLILALAPYIRSEQAIVEVPNGQLLGRDAITHEGTPYYRFEKIPFAAPPVGDLRFKAPQPPEDWDGILNATVLDVSCYQDSDNGLNQSEDCLYLSVYTPKLPSEEENELLPVMLFIFGGAYVTGWSGAYQPDLFLNHGVIYVAINYRLGAFGFLSTQDEIIPGNYGLKDQLMALQWTHDNIRYFGGDPDRVTIFGQSAGAGSCTYQILNQNAAGLFSAAILESGTSLSPGHYQRNARERAFAIGALLNETFETSQDSQALYDFLVSVKAEDLAAAFSAYSATTDPVFAQIIDQGFFAPVLEPEGPDAFITKKMYGLLKEGDVVRVPVLMGYNSEEILLRIFTPESVPDMMATIDEHLEYIVPYDMQITDMDSLQEMGAKIREIYTGGAPFADHIGGGIQYGSDQVTNRPMNKHAEFYSQVAPTYFYIFSYDGELGNFSLHFDGAESVAHLEELRYLFCDGNFAPCNNTDFPEADLITRARLLKIWTDFAKYQNPTPEPSELLQNITWPQLSIEDGDFLYVDINENLEIRNHPKGETYGKWEELYGSLGYDDFDTY